MSVTWNANLYLEIIGIYMEEAKKKPTVLNSHILMSLNKTRDEIFKKSSVSWHMAKLKKICTLIVKMNKDSTILDYNNIIRNILKTNVATFTLEDISKLRDFGVFLLEKLGDEKSLNYNFTKKKDKNVSQAILEKDRKKVDPKIIRSVNRILYVELEPPLRNLVSERLDKVIESVITPRVLSKIISGISDQIVSIFSDELRKYKPEGEKRPREVIEETEEIKRVKVSEEEDDDDEEEDDEEDDDE
jgi:hypothetical protein